MQTDTDEQLLRYYLEGDLAAFSMLYSNHKGGLYRYFLRQVRTKQEAEDLFQDCWSKVIDNAHRFTPQAKFTTWLYTIARNQLIDQHRHLKVVEKIIDDSRQLEDDDVGGQVSLATEETKIHLQRKHQLFKICLQKLPRSLVDVFVLKEETNLTAGQIAEVVDASHEATKSRLRYAYKKLRECITSKLSSEKNLGGGDEQTA